jgi:hypothetical protein
MNTLKMIVKPEIDKEYLSNFETRMQTTGKLIKKTSDHVGPIESHKIKLPEIVEPAARPEQRMN